jgi:hypothetical protein
MNMNFYIRSYSTEDYDEVKALYLQSELYGGVFDEARDSKEKLRKRVEADPDSILVAIQNDRVVGTVSLIEDGRVAWLYRFCVPSIVTDNENRLIDFNEREVTESLNKYALNALRAKGHEEVLVYTSQDTHLHKRYLDLGFTKGSDYTCFWKSIKE